MQYGQLRQLVGVNVGTECIGSACCSSIFVVCDLCLAETSERASVVNFDVDDLSLQIEQLRMMSINQLD